MWNASLLLSVQRYRDSASGSLLTYLKTCCSNQAEIVKQEARLKLERENLEKEKSVLTGTASSLDNQDGALEITVSGEKYRCLRFSKAKK